MSDFARLVVTRDLKPAPRDRPKVLNRKEPAVEFIRRLYGDGALRRDYAFHPYNESSWLSPGNFLAEEPTKFRRFLRRAKLFLEYNFSGGGYYIENTNTITVPKIVKLLCSKRHRESTLRHELTHHAQRGTRVTNQIYSSNIDERTAAWIALEGPAVYSQIVYSTEAYSKYYKLRDNVAHKILERLAKLAKSILRLINHHLGDDRTFTAEAFVSIPFNDLYSHGIKLAIYIAGGLRFGPKRMFEILCNNPPRSLNEATNPESYIERLRSEGLVV